MYQNPFVDDIISTLRTVAGYITQRPDRLTHRTNCGFRWPSLTEICSHVTFMTVPFSPWSVNQPNTDLTISATHARFIGLSAVWFLHYCTTQLHGDNFCPQPHPVPMVSAPVATLFLMHFCSARHEAMQEDKPIDTLRIQLSPSPLLWYYRRVFSHCHSITVMFVTGTVTKRKNIQCCARYRGTTAD